MALKFGTSGLRGLVSELSPEAVRAYVEAYVEACDCGTSVFVGRDLRPSSPQIAQHVIKALRAKGLRVVDCGALPTPALALAALESDGGAIMVTGSHIPADRNGLKFYSRSGEITKADEAAILAAYAAGPTAYEGALGPLVPGMGASEAFLQRYLQAFGPSALRGRRIGVYSHSAVGRDLICDLFRLLGAEVEEFGRVEHFIPVDTEALDPQTLAQIQDWVRAHHLDALVSSDGDSDRPLLADEQGRIVPGDIMGQITADYLRAEHVVTPISSNSGILQKGIRRVDLCRIGSPYVIAGMAEAESGARVIGYEANGGFLLGFRAEALTGPISALRTRDFLLPLIAVLVAARGGPVSARVAQEPQTLTRSACLREVPSETSAAWLADLRESPARRVEFLTQLGLVEVAVNSLDGLRMTLQGGDILHLRPSGNAPEFRLYVETEGEAKAADLLARAEVAVSRALDGTAPR